MVVVSNKRCSIDDRDSSSSFFFFNFLFWVDANFIGHRKKNVAPETSFPDYRYEKLLIRTTINMNVNRQREKN